MKENRKGKNENFGGELMGLKREKIKWKKKKFCRSLNLMIKKTSLSSCIKTAILVPYFNGAKNIRKCSFATFMKTSNFLKFYRDAISKVWSSLLQSKILNNIHKILKIKKLFNINFLNFSHQLFSQISKLISKKMRIKF